MRWIILAAGVLLTVLNSVVNANVVLIEKGQSRAAIYVPASVMMADRPATAAPPGKFAAQQAEMNRRRLRDSVKDLAACLEKMSGAKIEIVAGPPADADTRFRILVGELASRSFGPVATTFPWQQAFRVVVSPRGVGLMGESDLAASYAIYEVLDRLGCRWYMPGELGEVVPERKTVALDEMDFTGAPSTVYRGGFGDEPFRRRNRLGGLPMICGFGALEGSITADQRRQHPDWMASVTGKLHLFRLKWSNLEVAAAIAQRITDAQERDRQASMSLFLGGGEEFDESAEDRALDAGDIDPMFGRVSVSDRMLVLTNRVAARVKPKSPNLLITLSAYSLALRAPRREKTHPNLVPVIVPSIYDRAHPMSEAASPSGAELRRAIEGWAGASSAIGYYPYIFNQAEPTAPNPMIARWSADLPFILRNKCLYWIPEALGNYEAGLPGLYLEMRLTWNANQKPADLMDDFMRGFYGNASKEMAAYWSHMDAAWTQTPVYAGACFGYLRRFPSATLTKARELMDAATATARTPQEQARVKMAEESLRLFELYMKMRRNFADGQFAELPADSERWLSEWAAAGKRHAGQGAFDPSGAMYFRGFCRPLYSDAARIAATCQILTPKPLRKWRWQTDPNQRGQDAGWSSREFNDNAWNTTDPCLESWANLGLYGYFGAIWYRARLDLPPIQPGARQYLWLGGIDDHAKVYINGKLVPYVDDKGKNHEWLEGFNIPMSLEITGAVAPDGGNQIAVLCIRKHLNEIGTGGLLGPVLVYAKR